MERVRARGGRGRVFFGGGGVVLDDVAAPEEAVRFVAGPPGHVRGGRGEHGRGVDRERRDEEEGEEGGLDGRHCGRETGETSW